MGLLFKKASGRLTVQYEVQTIGIGAQEYPVEELVAMTDSELRSILIVENLFQEVEIPEAQLFSLLYDFGRVQMDKVSDLTDADTQHLQWLLANGYHIHISTPFGWMQPCKIRTNADLEWVWEVAVYEETEWKFSLVTKKDIRVYEIVTTELTDWDDYGKYLKPSRL